MSKVDESKSLVGNDFFRREVLIADRICWKVGQQNI